MKMSTSQETERLWRRSGLQVATETGRLNAAADSRLDSWPEGDGVTEDIISSTEKPGTWVEIREKYPISVHL